MKLDGNATAAVLLSLLVLLSGCATDFGDDTAPTEGTTPAGTSDEPTENATESGGERPFSDDEHAAVLRAAGSFTYVERTHVEDPRSGDGWETDTTARVNVETGELRKQQNLSALGGEGSTAGIRRSEQAYVAPSGDGYVRTSFGADTAVSYVPSPPSENATGYVRPDLGPYLDGATFEDRGVETVSGTETDVYVVSDPDEFGADDEGSVFGFERESLTELSARLYVTDDGLLKRFEMDLAATNENRSVEVRTEVTYRNVGSTTVEEPSWLPEAEEEVTERKRQYTETVTETVRDDDLGAAVTVTGTAMLIDRVELGQGSGWVWDTEGGFRDAQVASMVEVRTPSDVDIEELALSYDESAVPDGDEEGVVVYRYNESLQTFFPVSSEVDTEENVARAEIDRDGIYLAMHGESWRALWGE